jgi:hypothetical protein
LVRQRFGVRPGSTVGNGADGLNYALNLTLHGSNLGYDVLTVAFDLQLQAGDFEFNFQL